MGEVAGIGACVTAPPGYRMKRRDLAGTGSIAWDTGVPASLCDTPRTLFTGHGYQRRGVAGSRGLPLIPGSGRGVGVARIRKEEKIDTQQRRGLYPRVDLHFRMPEMCLTPCRGRSLVHSMYRGYTFDRCESGIYPGDWVYRVC
jgi:hypothetical protein